MAEENEDGMLNEDEGSEKPAVAHKRKILLLLLPIFLVVGTVVGVYFSGVADSFLAVKKPDQGEEKPLSNPFSVFFDLPELLVNLSGKAGQKPIYFKVKVTLEMNSAADAEQAERLLPRIIDSLQFYLREMRVEELQGSVGTYRLKEEIQGRLNKVLAPAKVNDVLFKEILIQ